MKKILLGLSAFIMMFAASCEQQELTPNLGSEATVSFNVATPQIATKAYSDGLTANILQYAVYNAAGQELTDLTVTDGRINGSTTVELQLTTGNTYSVIFWAAAEDAPYTVDFANKTMTVNYGSAKCNDESRDAFYAYKEFTVSGAQTETITLKRPFAQLNIGTADYEDAKKAGYVPTQSAVTVKNVYKTLDLVEGEATGEVEIIFAANDIPVGERFPVTGYEYLAMNYLLVNAEKEIVDIEFTYTDGSNAKTRTVGSVPVQRNYRTNIYGSLLTSEVDINVEIKPGFEVGMLEAWDGFELSEPTFDAATKTYHISHAAELAYIAQLVNGTLDTENVTTRAAVEKNSLKGYTVSLDCDINLNGKEWTPIGVGGNHFQGTLKGNNKTIHGLKVTERPNGTSQAALFGTVSGDVTITDLTIKGAEINGLAYTDKDFYGSALIGTMYGTVIIKNVNIVDSYISGNNKVGALVGHDGVCSSFNVENCVVDGVKLESTCVEDGGLVGGLVGYFQGVAGKHNIKNTHVKNCTFNVVNSTNTGKRANSQFFGGIDSKTNQILYIDGCTVANNTWNEKFYVDGVEVTEGKYESLYVAEDIVWIGGERDDNAQGKVIVNGEEIVVMKPVTVVNENGEEERVPGIGILEETTGDNQNKVYTFGVTAADGLKWISEQISDNSVSRSVANSNYNVSGSTVKLLADIDLSDTNWDPIGDNRTDVAFTGVFDGQDHTITGAHITGDHCFNGAVYGSKEGWGLFSVLDGATVKNLKVDGATFGSYTVISGVIAGYANNTTFENIDITNSKVAGYNWYTGGVVGWAAGECTFKNVNLDETVAVGTLWDSHGQNAGGIAGGVSSSAKITIEDCNIACVMDVINDVTSNYKWYIYRVSGMIIGNTNTTETKYNEVVTATATNVTCKNVTVTYGKWMNYHYCEGFWNRGWGRYESSDYVGGVDQNEPHNHAEGEQHCVCIPFDQLFGGSSNGSGHYPVKGLAEFPGVTVVYPEEYTCPVCGQQHNVK